MFHPTVTFTSYSGDIIRNSDIVEKVATRIPENDLEWLRELEAETGANRAEVLRRLLDRGLREWRREKALALLRDGKITIRNGAEMADIPYIEMLGLLSEEDIPTGYDEKELKRDIARF